MRYHDRTTILNNTQRRIIGGLFLTGLTLAILQAGIPLWIYLALMAPGTLWGFLIYLDELPYAQAAKANDQLQRQAAKQARYEAALERERAKLAP